jgi:hypothetical protein
MWLPVLLAFAYSGWVLYSRHADHRRLEEEAEKRRADQDRQIVDKIGGGELKVLMFYADPPTVRRGDAVRLCYGVAMAESVRIEPAVEGVGPALSRCVETKPIRRTTTYTLRAAGKNGAEATSTVAVAVVP